MYERICARIAESFRERPAPLGRGSLIFDERQAGFRHSARLMASATQAGFVAVVLVTVILSVVVALSLSPTLVFLYRLKDVRNARDSQRAYYAAESGIEDILLRKFDVAKPMPATFPYTFQMGDGTSVSVSLQEEIGGIVHYIARGDKNQRIQEINTAIAKDIVHSSFSYGVQVGAGGLRMSNGSRVNGSVYSGGSVRKDGTGDTGTVTGDVFVAGNGNRIFGVNVGGDAYAYSMSDCEVTGDAVYVEGGSIGDCIIRGSTSRQANEIPSLSFPISQETVYGWKQDAVDGGIISSGDFNPPGRSTTRIGPGVISGNMILTNNQTIILTGLVYITGYIDIDNGAKIQLDSSYGVNSGLLLTDGWIHISNNGQFRGSGAAGSYLMVFSTVSCRGDIGTGCTHHNSAIDIHNNAEGAIFYASDGLVHLHNGVRVTELTAWGISLDNNAILEYSIGLADLSFSSGPSGGWTILYWREQ